MESLIKYYIMGDSVVLKLGLSNVAYKRHGIVNLLQTTLP